MTPARTSVEHYASVVSPSRWKDVYAAMLTVCFDGAGKDQPKYNIIVVAGLAWIGSAAPS